jgi:hypothetical protein
MIALERSPIVMEKELAVPFKKLATFGNVNVPGIEREVVVVETPCLHHQT